MGGWVEEYRIRYWGLVGDVEVYEPRRDVHLSNWLGWGDRVLVLVFGVWVLGSGFGSRV